MNPQSASGPARAAHAVADLKARAQKALACFAAADQPPWRRTQAAMLCFAKLPLDPLPRRHRDRVDQCFARINDVLAGYDLQTWDDYQKISADDLSRIETLLRRFAGPA